ncbi:MAG: hypothetical protein GY694_17430 [Gammaproteobacteria bacterium]|nr:hypothetical protein [Gammaproteobacteria bacterium]
MMNIKFSNFQLSLILLLIGLFLISACTPSIKKIDPHKYYTLYFQDSENKAATPIYDFVKVDLPHAPTNHMTTSILYSENLFQRNSYSQSKWKEPLPTMLQEWLVQSINNMNLFSGVIRVASRANVPLMLETDIVKFEHATYNNEVNVSLRVILIQYAKRKVIKQRLFNYKIKVDQASAESAVHAFNIALQQFNNELYLWLK